MYERTRFDGECRGRRDGNRGEGSDPGWTQLSSFSIHTCIKADFKKFGLICICNEIGKGYCKTAKCKLDETLQFFVRDGFLDCYDRYREGVNFAIHAVTFQRAAQDVRECAAECDRMRDSPARGADGCFAFAFKR